MTLESTKTVGPASALAKYSTLVDGFAADPTGFIDELLSKREAGEWPNFVSALLAVVGYTLAGHNAVRVGFSDSFATSAHAFLNFGFSRVLFRNSANTAYVPMQAETIYLGNGRTWSGGSGSPEGVVSAEEGSLYTSSAGGANVTFYVKESGGSGNTGWVAK